MAQPVLVIGTFNVGGTHRVTLTIPMPEPGKESVMAMEWNPCIPASMDDTMLADYQNGRNKLLQEAAKKLGGTVLCIE